MIPRLKLSLEKTCTSFGSTPGVRFRSRECINADIGTHDLCPEGEGNEVIKMCSFYVCKIR